MKWTNPRVCESCSRMQHHIQQPLEVYTIYICCVTIYMIYMLQLIFIIIVIIMDADILSLFNWNKNCIIQTAQTHALEQTAFLSRGYQDAWA